MINHHFIFLFFLVIVLPGNLTIGWNIKQLKPVLQLKSILNPQYYQSQRSYSSLQASTDSIGITSINSDDQSLPPSSSTVCSPGLHIKIKNKVLNPFGLYCGIITFIGVVAVLPIIIIASILSDIFGNSKQRRIVDWIINFWARMSIIFSFGFPVIKGLENLPSYNENVIYVPNHTSFLDILFLSGFVPRRFKYFSKAEIGNIPGVGLAMKLAKHIFLKRDDFQSTIEATQQCVQTLKDGNSVVLFAEGTRSPDGRLKTFKKGTFQIAKEADVKIIPISIGNLYQWMPNYAILPLAPMRNTFITIHPAIETKDIPVSKLKNICLEAVNNGLPEHQKSLSIVDKSSLEP